MNEEFYKLWDDFSQDKISKLNKLGNNWYTTEMTDEEKEIASLLALDLDMNNGGFLQFFCNWGFDAYNTAVEALKNTGSSDMLVTINKAYSLIEKYEDDERIAELWDLAKVLTDEEYKQLDKLDSLYWDQCLELPKRAYNFYSK